MRKEIKSQHTELHIIDFFNVKKSIKYCNNKKEY